MKPGVLIEFKIRISIGLLLGLLTLLFVFLFAKYPLLRDTITFTASAIGAALGIYGAYYTATGLSLKIRHDRVSRAFEFLEQTNRIEFTQALAFVEQINVEDKPDEKYKALRSDGKDAQVRFLLNMLEDIAIAVRTGYADEEVLFSSLSGIVDRSYNKLTFYIKRLREEFKDKDDTIYCEIQKLVSLWNKRR